MNVLFVTRLDALTRPGGDTIQLQKTKEALEVSGVRVRLGQAEGELLAWADIIHVFNAQTPESSLPALRAARACGKKAVLSTIWWNLDHAHLVERLAQYALSPHLFWTLSLPLFKLIRDRLQPSFIKAVSETVYAADLLLPNSEEEMAWLRRDLGSDLPRYKVVMNAVDTKMFSPCKADQVSGVLCCARLEPTKNQLSLIRAVAGLPGVHLTLAGRSGQQDGYIQQIRREIRSHRFTLIEEHLSQEEVVKLMHQHIVHALPSFRESPGLSSLEAIACGLKAVVSSNSFCPVDTYFSSWLNDRVYTCNPYRISDLRNAISKALSYTANPLVFPKELTWTDVGRQTLEAYNAI